MRNCYNNHSLFRNPSQTDIKREDPALLSTRKFLKKDLRQFGIRQLKKQGNL